MAKAVARCTCEMCGAVYTVLNPAQKYCEACAPIAIRERIRERNRKRQEEMRKDE